MQLWIINEWMNEWKWMTFNEISCVGSCTKQENVILLYSKWEVSKFTDFTMNTGYDEEKEMDERVCAVNKL